MTLKLLVFLIRLYKKYITPFMVTLFGYGCRFNPSCSHYAVKALSEHGLLLGLKLSCKRLIRCHPFYKGSNFDPVPQVF